MNHEDQPPSETERRKFDDVASLFGRIVPAPGTPVRQRPTPPQASPLPDVDGPIALPQSLPPPHPDSVRPLFPTPRRLELDPAAPPVPNRPSDWPPAPEPASPAPAPPPAPEALVAPPAPDVSRQVPTKPSKTAKQRKEDERRASQREVPWPDAFAPQPNFRRRSNPQSWALFLLIPVLLVIALGVLLLDPRTVRTFIDSHLRNLQSPRIGDVMSLVPAPFRPQAAPPTPPTQDGGQSAAPVPPATGEAAPRSGSADQPSAPPPATPESPPASASPPTPAPTTSSSAAPPEAAPSAVEGATAPPSPPAAASETRAAPAEASAPEPTPPVPTQSAQPQPSPGSPPPEAPAAASPVIAPAAPPPAAPAPLAAAPAPVSRIVVHYRRNQPGSEAEGRRVAAQVETLAVSVDLRPSQTSVRAPTIMFYNPGDHDAAIGVARNLGGEGRWSVKAGTGRNPAGTLEIWLP